MYLLLGLLFYGMPLVYASPHYQNEFMNLRDPFRMPSLNGKNQTITELEKFPMESLALTGVLTGPSSFRALIRTPDGQTHTAGIGDRIGQRNGKIDGITEDSVKIVEKGKNILGEDEVIHGTLDIISERLQGEVKGEPVSSFHVDVGSDIQQ
jgi:Tfp pilus assembly protein PilP